MQAALLAAVLPNPHERDARRPGPGLRRLAGLYAARAARAPEAAKCLRAPATSHWRDPSSISPASNRHFATFQEFPAMAVPKRKTSPSRRGMRRSADALKRPTYVEDKDSGELRRPHHIDLKTGMYKGRQVLKVKTEA